MKIGLTKMSSKGQIVIPKEMRKSLKEGDKLLIFMEKSKFVLKKITNKEAEDIEFAKRTEKAYQEYKKGKYYSQDASEFLKDLEKWANK